MAAVRSVLALAGAVLAGSESCYSGTYAGGTCEDGGVATNYGCCGVGPCTFKWWPPDRCGDCQGGCRRAKRAVTTKIKKRLHDTPLNEWPMLMTHDSGTGYAQDDTCTALHAVNNYAVTQPTGGFKQQLDCGARAFDLRPYVTADLRLVMHHGKVLFHTTMDDALRDITDWSKWHPQTLVVVFVSHCKADSEAAQKHCRRLSGQSIARAGIKRIMCPALGQMTVGMAMKVGQIEDGGGVIALEGCVAENFDSKIQCYGGLTSHGKALTALQNKVELDPGLRPVLEFARNHSSREGPLGGAAAGRGGDGLRGRALAQQGGQPYQCWGQGKEHAFNKLWSYMKALSNGQNPPFQVLGYLWMLQAHWQYDEDSIAEGAIKNSCILKDTIHSHLNTLLVRKILAGEFKYINLLEVDAVCHKGPELFEAIRNFAIDKADREVREEEAKFEELQRGALASVLGRPGHLQGSLAACVLVGLGAAAAAAVLLRRRTRRSVALADLQDPCE